MYLQKMKQKLAVCLLTAATSFGLIACNNSTVLNPQINGVNGPTFTVLNGYMILSMTFTNMQIDGGLTMPIPKYPNSSLAIGPDFQTGGLLLTLTVAVGDLPLGGFQFYDAQSLPGGRPLPGVAQGFLPAVAIQVPQLNNTVFYVSADVLGMFVPTNFDPSGSTGGILTLSFYNTSNVRVGNISLVGADVNKQNAGILVLVNIAQTGAAAAPKL